LTLAAFGLGIAALAVAQEPRPAGARKGASPPAGFRKLAPGVETTIAPPVDPQDTVETYNPHSVVELLAPGVVPNLDWTPKYSPPTKTLREMAKDRPFRRTTWYLQFTFKPLRLIEIEMPAAGGQLERKVVWYMVYRVKNIGGHLKPAENAQADADPLAGAPQVESVADPGQPIHFFPKFSLEGEIDGVKRAYADQVIPLAIAPIRHREDPNRKLLDSVQISAQGIPLSTATEDNSVWGVATWVDVDPRIDFFSIYVNGLTSAYRWTDPPGAFKAGDPPTTGRQFTRKTLQLNFWRPGDEFNLLEDEIFIGAPNDKVVKLPDPDKPPEEAAAASAPGRPAAPPAAEANGANRDWDKIIDYRWIFR